MRRKLLAIFKKFNFYGAVNNSFDLILNLDQSKFDIKVVFLKENHLNRDLVILIN